MKNKNREIKFDFSVLRLVSLNDLLDFISYNNVVEKRSFNDKKI